MNNTKKETTDDTTLVGLIEQTFDRTQIGALANLVSFPRSATPHPQHQSHQHHSYEKKSI